MTDVFVDFTLKITGKGVEEVEPLTAKLEDAQRIFQREHLPAHFCCRRGTAGFRLGNCREVISASKSLCTARNSNEKPCKNEKSNSVWRKRPAEHFFRGIMPNFQIFLDKTARGIYNLSEVRYEEKHYVIDLKKYFSGEDISQAIDYTVDLSEGGA